MRVLYLVPPGPWPHQIARYSFIDEEIRGLVAAGVKAFVPSVSVPYPAKWHRVQMLPMRVGRSASELIGGVRMMVAHRAAAQPLFLRHARRALYSARVEKYVAQLVRRHRVDIIHSHFGPAVGLGGLLASRATGRPLVATFRGMDLLLDESLQYGLRREPFYDEALRALLREMDAGTFATEFMRRAAAGLGAPEDRLVTIPKGVDLARFRPAGDRAALRKSLGLTGPTIVTVAGLIRRKGVDVILEALSTLKDSHDFTFVVCGDGPQRAELERLATRLGVRRRTRFLGQVARGAVARWFAASDMFVLASRLEAAGNVLLEAMAAARPVICTDAGGPPEYVRHEETGYIVPVGDAAALAARIRLLLDRPDLADRIGACGRDRVERLHPYERLIEGYLDVYRAVLGEGVHEEPAPRVQQHAS
jgi:glycosyltransferase involved in cell wall biosynthesis